LKPRCNSAAGKGGYGPLVRCTMYDPTVGRSSRGTLPEELEVRLQLRLAHGLFCALVRNLTMFVNTLVLVHRVLYEHSVVTSSPLVLTSVPCVSQWCLATSIIRDPSSLSGSGNTTTAVDAYATRVEEAFSTRLHSALCLVLTAGQWSSQQSPLQKYVLLPYPPDMQLVAGCRSRR
jgi:hypothetical protein